LLPALLFPAQFDELQLYPAFFSSTCDFDVIHPDQAFVPKLRQAPGIQAPTKPMTAFDGGGLFPHTHPMEVNGGAANTRLPKKRLVFVGYGPGNHAYSGSQWDVEARKVLANGTDPSADRKEQKRSPREIQGVVQRRTGYRDRKTLHRGRQLRSGLAVAWRRLGRWQAVGKAQIKKPRLVRGGDSNLENSFRVEG
jgi:hypothetical protein